MTDIGLRTALFAALLAGVCAGAAAQHAAPPPAGLELPILPDPLPPFADRPLLAPPALPEVVVAIPDATPAGKPAPPNSPPASETARIAALEPPGLPQPGDPHEAILNPPATASTMAPSERTATVAQPTPPAVSAGDGTLRSTVPLIDAALPEPGDPNRAIAMLAPRAAPVAPTATPPAERPAPRIEPMRTEPSAPRVEPASPALADRLSPEALGQALLGLARQQGMPETIARSAREFYEKRDFAPLWTEGGALTPTARAVLATIAGAGSHGLSSARFARLQDQLRSADGTEMREAALAMLAVAYARDARGARLNPQSVSRLITATPSLPDADDVLQSLQKAKDAGQALESYNPRHKGYAALREKLLALAAPSQPSTDAQKLTFGPVLTQGMSDPRVPIVRGLLGVPASEDPVLDRDLVNALRAYQRDRGLRVTGRLDRATTAALGGVEEETASARNPRADIIANMERWRWLPADLGDDHVFVNVPDYAMQFVRDGAVALRGRVIVGKPQTQTPIFSDRMQFLVVNPAWNVPPSITLKEYLPLLQKNPHALAARGLEVISRGKVVDPATVDWSKVGRSVAIRQPPGERNALGHIKFMFPNQHAVYLHDTPGRHLFSAERRAFSHGCVRVQDPFRLAEALMGQDWPERRLRGMVGGGERRINLPEEIPVHLAYFTTFVDETGSLHTREDLYGHNRRVKALLGL